MKEILFLPPSDKELNDAIVYYSVNQWLKKTTPSGSGNLKFTSVVQSEI